MDFGMRLYKYHRVLLDGILDEIKACLKIIYLRLEKFYSYVSRQILQKDERVILVTFTGGLGAQVLSAAIYFQLESEGKNVYADFTYFQNAEHVASAGNIGELSYWGWQLQGFHLFPASFRELKAPSQFGKRIIIRDGINKITRAFSALGCENVRKHFVDDTPLDGYLPLSIVSNYMCIHIRRGDYVNLASHLIGDDAFLATANRISNLVDGVVVLSDSKISDNFRKKMAVDFDKSIFLDEIDAIASHRIMRGAKVLICSNSQFSLTAALLNPRALVLLPTQWQSKDNRELDLIISEMCDFQLMVNKKPYSMFSSEI